MKSIVSVFALALLLLLGCDKDENVNLPKGSLEFKGAAQKGPYITGSTIVVQELGEDLAPFGNVFYTSILDDFGTFEVGTTFSSPYFEVIAEGYYFNEVSGQLSSAELTLRSLVQVSDQTVSNVNLLTTLSSDRITHLIGEGLTFEEATNQAGTELLGIFGIELDDVDFNSFDMSASNEKAAVLIAISSIFQADNTVAELSEFIAQFIADFKEDGEIDSERLDLLRANAQGLHMGSIRHNLVERYASLGLEVEIPHFEAYAKRLVAPSVTYTFPEDASVGINFETLKVEIQFDQEMMETTLNNENVMLKNGDHIVSTQLQYQPNERRLTIFPDEPINPSSVYTVVISEQVKNVSGLPLEEPKSFSFTTMSFDLESDLVFHFQGSDTEDSNGSSIQLHPFNTGLTENRHGDPNSAHLLSMSLQSYIELPHCLNLHQSVWTFSLWVKLTRAGDYDELTLLGHQSDGTDGPWLDIYASLKTWDLTSNTEYARVAFAKDNNYVTTGAYLSKDQWYQVTVTQNENSISYYLNGSRVYEVSGNFEYQYSCEKPYEISDKETPARSFDGAVSDIIFYRRSLNELEVKSLFESASQ